MKFSSINFTCSGCGAPYRFDPSSQSLKCEFCRSQEPIEQSSDEIVELDLSSALSKLNQHSPVSINKELSCKKCGAGFTLTPYSFSSECPFCNTPALTDFTQELKPASLIPFKITQQSAKESFKEWIGSLWFAPSALQELVDDDGALDGYYLPHWTFDAHTSTSYSGLRGDVYYVAGTKTITRNGVQQRVRVTKAEVRWRVVSGNISVDFDDISTSASTTISRVILDNLAPWHTSNLVKYNEKYITGFEAEEYAIGLDNGFEAAKAKMHQKILHRIRQDIGGDKQRINSTNTTYYNTTYKSVLFPIWSATFEFGGKKYSYAINAQTGLVAGERPYSKIKIALTTIVVIGLAVAGLAITQDPNLFK